MSVTETLSALGSWEIQLLDETPDYILDQLGFFGHLAIADGYVDVAGVGAGLLTGARYVGVLRAKDKDTGRTLSGSGMVFWLGDEDGKGDLIETEISLTAQTLSQCVTAIVGPSNAVTVGTVHSIAGTYTGKHQFQTRREALSLICDAFNAEFRVNGDGSVDVGTAAQLYNTEAPDTIVVRKGSGVDMDLVALGGEYEVGENAYDYSTKALLLGQTIGTGDTPDEVFAVGSATAVSVPYLNLRGNTVKMVRTISESGTTTGSVAARAQLQLNRFNRVARSLKVTAEEYETEGNFVVGDNVYVYDPDTGIVNAANEVTFRGEVLHPDIVRASGITWPVVQGMTVAFRTQAGVWLDLTPFVTWETGGNELTVGDLPKSLTKPGDNPVQVRLDAVRADASIPNAPTALTLTTYSTLNAQGVTGAVIHAAWTAPTLNTDGSVITDLSHYVIQYRWTARAPQWQEAPVTADTERDIIVTPGLPYEVRVAAVDLGGKLSAWTSTGTITSAADAIAPNPPADPVVTSYLGQLRIEYAGTDSTGNPMASDTNRIDVHVSATSGFTPSTATRVSSITPFAKGVAYATAPYGSTRYVKLVAVDHSGNPSASSGQVSGATTQVADGDVASMSVGKLTAGTMSADVVMSGRFTTALTGQRREMNAVGFQAYNAANALTVNIDGVSNLLTGKLQTALTGRRIVIGSTGSLGQMDFFAPDGTQTFLRSFTGLGGNEAIQLAVAGTGGNPPLATMLLQSDESSFVIGKRVSVMIGGYTTGTRDFRVEYAPSKADMNAGRLDLFLVTPDETWASFTNLGGWSIRERRPGSYLTRMYIDGAGYIQFFFDIGAAGFVVNENVSGVAYSRMLLGGDRNNYFTTLGGQSTSFMIRRNDGTTWTKQFMYDAGWVFYYENLSRVVISTQYGVDASPGLSLIHDTNFGTLMAHVSTTTGASHRLEFHDAGNSIFENLWAAAFVVSSSEVGKGDIRDLEPGALDTVAGMSVKKFRRRAGRPQQEKPGREDAVSPREAQLRSVEMPELSDRVEIGVIAEEAPADIVITGDDHTPMVDLGSWVALNTAAIKELKALVDGLTKGANP